MTGRDRNAEGRAEQARPRDELGRPLPYGATGVEPVSDEPRPPDETIEAAHDLLARGRPFSAHEIYEARWKSCPPAERELWKGMAQLCVGITHGARGNVVGADRLVERGAERLAAYSGPTYTLDVDDEIARARDLVTRGATGPGAG